MEFTLNVGRDDKVVVTLEQIQNRFQELTTKKDGVSTDLNSAMIINAMRIIPFDEDQALDRAAIVYGHIYSSDGSLGVSIEPGFRHPHWTSEENAKHSSSNNENVFYCALDAVENDHVLVWIVDPEGFDIIGGVMKMRRGTFYSTEYDFPQQFHNLTQNKVNFVGPDGAIAVSLGPAQNPAIFTPERKNVGYVMSANPDGVPVKVPLVTSNGGKLINMPPQEPGHAFIVTRMVQDQIHLIYPYRNDTFVTTGTIRDEDGRIIGCQALTTQ